jgi:Protein of unknown function (DUF2975)
MKALGKGSIASYLEIALNVVSVILWITLGGVILGALAYAVAAVLVSAGALPATIFEGGQGRVDGGAFRASFNLDAGLAWQLVVPTLLAALVAVAGGLIIVRRLKRLFESFRSAEPFRKENATHLRVIWVTMIVIELSRHALMAITGVLIAAFGEPPGTDWKFNVNINLMTWAAILVLIVLAEVFREGARLREEQELTI